MISNVLKNNCKVNREKPILLGVSGGPDSIFMLDTLYRSGYNLIIAHLDHQLRPDSLEEAENVEKIAKQLGLPCIVEHQDVQKFAFDQKLSIEQAARQVRYEFLFQQAVDHNVQAVAVGHNADDQIETVLLHLLRGSGLAGLAGIKYRSLPNQWSRKIPLIRPILGVWREQILEYLGDKTYQTNQDSSNWDKTYFRNRIRHELIPILESYNPQLKKSIYQMSSILDDDEEVLQKMTQKAWNHCLLKKGKGFLQFDLSALQSQPIALQRRLMREAFAVLLNNLSDIEFQHIDQGTQFINHPPKSGFSQLAAGLNISKEQDFIFLYNQQTELPDRHWPQLHASEPVEITIPGEVILNEQWVLRSSLLDYSSEIFKICQTNQNLYLAYIDYDHISQPLFLRTRKVGDRFRPLGLAGKTKKLSDCLIDQKMPVRSRNNWPLLVSRDEIIWVPGYQIDYNARLDCQTKRVLFLQLEQI